MGNYEKVTITIDEEALKLIDLASKVEYRGNRSKFLESAGVEKAKALGVQ